MGGGGSAMLPRIPSVIPLESFINSFAELWPGFLFGGGLTCYELCSGGATLIRWLVAPWGCEIQSNPV